MSVRSCTILGVDPGTTTGLFLVTVAVTTDDNGGDVTVRSDFTGWQVGRRSVPDITSYILGRTPAPSLVAVERYTITTRTARLTQQPTALEIIGVVKHTCDAADVAYVEQSKSNAAKLASDAALRSIGWHARGRRHENDAARHVLLSLAGHDPVIFEALMTYGRIDRAGEPTRNEDED